jgi:diaminohydroxyphosphoribosylaminopyrimidine deaminase/5-amino-6-(5-phosphoribosylamino)uracil reductase
LLIYQAPLLLGDAARGMFDLGTLTDLAAARRLAIVERRLVGTDFFLRARFSLAAAHRPDKPDRAAH